MVAISLNPSPPIH